MRKPIPLSTLVNTLLAVLLAVAAIAIAAAPASADTLELRNGAAIHGTYVGGSQYNIRFEVNGQVKYYSTKDVLTLSFDAAPAPPPAPPQPPVAPATPPPASAAQGSMITIPAGTVIEVRMIDSVDSSTNQVGDQFHASLENDLTVNSVVVAPKGADVYGKLEQVQSAGKIQGQSQLQLGLTGIRINRMIVPIATGDYDVAGSSRGKQSAERIGGGAALGAIIGAIAGGGKGAAAGAAIGGGAGTAVQVLTKGQQVRVPSETVLDFTLQTTFSVPAQ